MRMRRLLAVVFATGASVAVSPSTGCYGDVEYVAYDEPPPPREEVAVAHPGYFWIHGHWERYGSRWVWRGGFYQHERPGFAYAEGRWQHTDRGFVWIEGGWRSTGGVVYRETR